MSKSSPAARSRARRFALQALYQVQLSECTIADAEAMLVADHDMKRVDRTYLHELLSGIGANQSDLLALIASKLERTVDELDPIERAILLIGAFELAHRIELPYRVALNESVELAKQFGATESHKLVNKSLDELARTLRAAEYGRR